MCECVRSYVCIVVVGTIIAVMMIMVMRKEEEMNMEAEENEVEPLTRQRRESSQKVNSGKEVACKRLFRLLSFLSTLCFLFPLTFRSPK